MGQLLLRDCHPWDAFYLGVSFCGEPAGLLVHDRDILGRRRPREGIDQIAVGRTVDHKHLVDAALGQCIDDEIGYLDHGVLLAGGQAADVGTTS